MSLAKSFLRGLFALGTLPVWGTAWLVGALGGDRDRALAWASQVAAPLAGLPGEYARAAIHRPLLAGLGPDCVLGHGVLFSRHQARIGRGCYLGPGCQLGWVEMGDAVLLGSAVHIPSGTRQHDFSDPDIPVRDQGGSFSPVRVGEDTWIGNAAVVLADVGAHCVVGAGAVVTRSVPEGAIVAGNPAQVVGHRPGFGPEGRDG